MNFSESYFPTQVLSCLSKMNSNIKPNVFIVGAPKCGTTSMHNYLDQHPEIFMSEPKEPRFFCKDFHAEAETNNSKQYFPALTLDEYEECFHGAENYEVIGEASPIYLYSDVAIQKINEFNEDARIIVMLRDPVEQMYSWYYQSLQTGNEWTMSFKEALELESIRKQGKKLSSSRFPSSLFYTELANFSEQIKRLNEVFPEDQIKFILLDDLKTNPERVYKSTLEFLHVKDKTFMPDFEVENPSSVPRSKLFNKLKNPAEPIRKAIKKIVPRNIILSIIDMIDYLNITTKPKPDIDPELREELMEMHDQNVRECADLTGRDLPKIWGYDDR